MTLVGRLSALGIAASLALVTGCRQDMQDQPKYKPLAASRFWDNGASARALVENTVARGHVDDNAEFSTGKTADGAPVDVLPLPLTAQLLERGQQRFNIYCSPCHDRVGTGRGMVVRRGFKAPPSYHIDRLRQAPVGHFFEVMTNGFGAMPDYRAQVGPADRWAIVAYIRALQRSQQASLSDVPPEEAAKLKSGG